MWTDRIPFVSEYKRLRLSFCDGHIEMIEPEISHQFLQLVFTVDGPDQLLC